MGPLAEDHPLARFKLAAVDGDDGDALLLAAQLLAWALLRPSPAADGAGRAERIERQRAALMGAPLHDAATPAENPFGGR